MGCDANLVGSSWDSTGRDANRRWSALCTWIDGMPPTPVHVERGRATTFGTRCLHGSRVRCQLSTGESSSIVLDGNHRTGLLLVLDQHCASGVVRGVGCSGTTSQSQLGGTVTAAAVGNHIHATASCEG